MSKTIRGVYRNGRVELLEEPANNIKEGPVLITFLERGEIDLQTRGVTEEQAANLRARLASFTEGWETPEMGVYDDYDTLKSKPQTRSHCSGSLSTFESTHRQNASRIGCPTRRSEFGPGAGRRLHDYQQGIPLESNNPTIGSSIVEGSSSRLMISF